LPLKFAGRGRAALKITANNARRIARYLRERSLSLSIVSGEKIYTEDRLNIKKAKAKKEFL